jgi:hypothetical protein
MERTMKHGRTLVTLLVVALAGCASTSSERARALAGRGELAAAVEAAGTNRSALRDVSLAILVSGVERGGARTEAARALESGGAIAAPALRGLAASADPLASAAGAAALLRLGAGGRERAEADEGPLLALLRERARHADPEVRALAVVALAARSVDEPFLRASMADPDERVRLAAIDGLSRPGSDALGAAGAGVRGPLRSMLSERVRQDDSAPVRAAALRALSRFDQGNAMIDTAAAALGADEPLALRLAAVDALAAADDRDRAAAVLGEVLAGEGAEAVQVRAAVVLARRRDRGALARLEATLLGGDVVLASTAAIGAGQVGADMRASLLAALDRGAAEVRLHAAASLLGAGGGRRAVDELRGLMRERGWLGLHAALVLARGHEDLAGPRIDQALADPDAAVRAYAAGACAHVPGGLALARGALADRDERVRLAAAAAVLRAVARDDV